MEAPIIYEVDRARDGGSFSVRRIVAIQHGRPIFNMAASFHIEEDGLTHQSEMPEVEEPENFKNLNELMTDEVINLIPEKFYHTGITFPYFDGIVSGKISKQVNLISKTRSSDYSTSNYTLNFTKKFLDNSSLLSINLEGSIEGTSDHKVGLTYRETY